MEDFWILVCASWRCRDGELKGLCKELNEMLLDEEWRRVMRTRHALTAECLTSPSVSAWMCMYTNGTDANFLNVTSLTRYAFETLLVQFKPFFRIPPPSRQGGRPRKLRFHHQVLGALLHFYVGSMEYSTLYMVFDMPPATLSKIICRAERALANALVGFAPARISWPSPHRQVQLARLVQAREPLLHYTFGFVDGKNYREQEPSNADLQNAMYNGWMHTVFVTGTILFAADGCIVWSKHNCPGSWNDSDTSLEMREKLVEAAVCPDPRYGVVADSAFPCSGDMVDRILTPLKDGDLERIQPALRSAARTMNNAILSVRQAAEWIMGSVEKVYSRLLLPLPYDPEVRGVRLGNLFRLSNFRVRGVEISQIRTTFSGIYERSMYC